HRDDEVARLQLAVLGCWRARDDGVNPYRSRPTAAQIDADTHRRGVIELVLLVVELRLRLEAAVPGVAKAIDHRVNRGVGHLLGVDLARDGEVIGDGVPGLQNQVFVARRRDVVVSIYEGIAEPARGERDNHQQRGNDRLPYHA